jgi:hypothetical protein
MQLPGRGHYKNTLLRNYILQDDSIQTELLDEIDIKDLMIAVSTDK